MPTSSWSLQQAVHAAISTDPGVVGLIGPPRLFDDVPQGTPFPYLTLGQSIVRDWSTSTDTGDEHTFTLHVWSRASGRKEVHDILGALRAALHNRSLALAGHRLVNLRHEQCEARRDPDGETYHGILRLRAVTEPL